MTSGSARTGARALVLGSLVSLVVLASCGSATPEAGELPGVDDPAHGVARTDAWATIVEDLDAPLTDPDATSCHRGEPSCLAAVVEEMEVRLAERPCAHTAPFAFTYLEMTRGVVRAFDSFDEPSLIAVIDARFAQLYFDAFENWAAGRHHDVPAVWQLAFAVADGGDAPAAVDLLLGMNAHITRDLAYTVEQVVNAAPGEADDRGDFRRVNEVIAEVKGPMLAAAADRFDPTLALLDLEPQGPAAPDPVELIAEWRERAFEFGLRLAQAPTAEQRRAVVTELERVSAAAAGLLVAAEAGATTTGLPPAGRDLYCRQQLGG